jgi:uncharacterized protein YsxB (DUF464 family)
MCHIFFFNSCCAAVPTNFGPEVVCSSVSELVRMAAAALISLYVYLNFKQGPHDLAAGAQQSGC